MSEPTGIMKVKRPRAYDVRPERFQWYFTQIPETIRCSGDWIRKEDRNPDGSIPNPFRQRAIYVVHGMGEQRLSETAAALRLGFEGAVDKVDPQNWSEDENAADRWIVAQPYIYDGFWGNYHKVSEVEKPLSDKMTKGESEFFDIVWVKRSLSAPRTFGWLFGCGRKLIGKDTGNRLYYCALVPMLWLVSALCLPHKKTRRFIVAYLNDVRLYLDPHGDVEHTIVQDIDHEVGRKFLRLLGYDWELNPLPAKPKSDPKKKSDPKEFKLRISTEREHAFERVTWVAHSLGSVISYNVIGDILWRCHEIRENDEKRVKHAEAIEKGLAGFITLGSPLDKVKSNYPKVLRAWPKEYLPGDHPLSLWGRKGYRDEFWENFHYTSDPVSGRLDNFQQNKKSYVHNIHPKGLRVPGKSHLYYWRDSRALPRLLATAFGPYVNDLEVKVRAGWVQWINLRAGAFIWIVVALAVVVILGWWVPEQFGLWKLFGKLEG